MKEFGTMKKNEDRSDEVWKNFLKRHPGMAVALIGMIVGAAIVALFTFLWVLGDAQATGLVPALLGQWTVGTLFTFCLTVIFWELVLVASWVIPIVAILYFQWYKKLPEEEQKEYGVGRDKSAGEDGFSFIVGLVWLGIVWISGRWNLAFQSWTINDWVYTWLAACLPLLVIAGVLGLAYVGWSLGKDSK
jgi:hypothetical protein